MKQLILILSLIIIMVIIVPTSAQEATPEPQPDPVPIIIPDPTPDSSLPIPLSYEEASQLAESVATGESAIMATPVFETTAGCLQPPDDYTEVEINGETLNQRTVAMLAHAQTLYGGPIELTGRAITQGGYTGGAVSASFGTHDGGGAVDISVRNIPTDWSIRYDDIPILITALRTAGFAAWYRDESNNMEPHIHAIAIGDKTLSRAAQLQLNGRYGYFYGFDGLPQPDGIPDIDRHADIGVIVCNWMRELGYEDWRGTVSYDNFEPPYFFQIGDSVLVNMLNGEELNLRDGAGVGYTVITRLQTETPVIILDGNYEIDGYRWWKLQLDDGTEGWAADFVGGVLTLVPLPDEVP